MKVTKCKRCGEHVLAMEDGTCPSCRRPLENSPVVTVGETLPDGAMEENGHIAPSQNTAHRVRTPNENITETSQTISHIIPPLPAGTPYFVVHRAISDSRISENIAAGDLVFTPLGVFFLAGHFTLIPGDVPSSIRGSFLVDVQLYQHLRGRRMWKEFFKSLHGGTDTFRRNYVGTTPDWIADYPGVDVRFFPAGEHDKAETEGNWLTFAYGSQADEFSIMDEEANFQAIKDYLADPYSVRNHAELSDPLGFDNVVPGPMKVLVALSQGKVLPEFRELANATGEYASLFVDVVKNVGRDFFKAAFSNVAVLPRQFRKTMAASTRSRRRISYAKCIAELILCVLVLCLA